MMYIQGAAQRTLHRSTELTNVVIPSSHISCAPWPSRTIIEWVTSNPNRVIFSTPIQRLPSSKARVITERHRVELPTRPCYFIVTIVAIPCSNTFESWMILCSLVFALPLTHTISRTKIENSPSVRRRSIELQLAIITVNIFTSSQVNIYRFFYSHSNNVVATT